MPGTTRYSATFDRTYEEEAKPSSPPNARRSRSQSWQANSGHDGRQYTPFASRSPAPRSSSTDNSPNKGIEFIPTRTAKTSVKAHNNPFQFVKVGTCPLYKKAEEQLKKAKEIKKPDVLKEEEEEWQSNLDSWKSRRRKMSEDVFRRQEELKLLEIEEQESQVSNKKTKTFSEMVESRATRGRALSLCLLTSPLEFQNWEFENKTHKNGSCSYTDESGENSIVNSEDEGVSVRGRHEETSLNENVMNHRTNGDAHIEQNGTTLDKQNGNSNKLCNNVQLKTKENSYIDSGLESISSSHRAGDTPDSGSDFSQDSNSSIDCDSPRTGLNLLEEFNSKSSQISEGHEIRINLKLGEKGQDFGFTFLGGKDEGQVIIASILEGSKAESSGIHLGDRIVTIDGCDVTAKKHIEIAALIQKGREKNQMNLLLWRHTKTTNGTNGFNAEGKHLKATTDENFNAKYEKSIESENEMFVDDFEELKRQSELLINGNAQGVYALNVDSNQISQDGNSTNTLFPLSPVTELPSPADETKTMSSTLSSNYTLPVSNCQNGIPDEGKQKVAEIKMNIPVSKENNSVIPPPANTEKSKPSVLQTDLKNVENKTHLNNENKTETGNAPILTSKNKDSQDEKSKSQTTPKKVKVTKLKKGITSENAPATECTKVVSNAAQCNDATSKTLIEDKSSLESKSSHTLENKQCDIKNDVRNPTSSEAMENIISPSTISVKPSTAIINVPINVPSDCAVSSGTGIPSPKVVTSDVEAFTANKQSKILTSEDNKPKKTIQKKVITKSKDNTAKKETIATSSNATLNEIYSTKGQKSSPVLKTQEKMDSKNETAVPPLNEENTVSLNGIANIPQEIKASAKDETSIPCPSTNKVRDLALKFGVKKTSTSSESLLPAKNAMVLKTPISEKAKPEIVEKKESTKAKENCVEQNVIGSPLVLSPVSNSFESSSKNMALPSNDKQVKIAIKDEIAIASKRANTDVQAITNKQVITKSTTSSVSNASDSPSSKNPAKGIQLKKEKKTTPLSQDEQTKTVIKTEKVSPLSRVINFYKSHM